MDLRPGTNGMPCLHLTAPDGATAVIYADGAHVTSWRPAGGTSWRPAGGAEQLFLSPNSEFTPGRAIRGGVPLVFPQFSGEGPLPKHGFARNRMWQLEQAGVMGDQAGALFSLTDDAESRALWPSRFRATCQVVIGGDTLTVTLGVSNTDVGPFGFTAALHTYFAVTDCRQTEVHGLQDLAYRDAALGDAATQLWAMRRGRRHATIGRLPYVSRPRSIACTTARALSSYVRPIERLRSRQPASPMSSSGTPGRRWRPSSKTCRPKATSASCASRPPSLADLCG